MNRKEQGKKGEEIASAYLIENGYKILERNYTCPLGEIDIIAKKDGRLVFIEVKYRKSKKFGSPLAAVDIRKIGRLKKIVDYYCMINKIKDCPLKIEVVGITNGDKSDRIEHIKDIF